MKPGLFIEFVYGPTTITPMPIGLKHQRRQEGFAVVRNSEGAIKFVSPIAKHVSKVHKAGVGVVVERITSLLAKAGKITPQPARMTFKRWVECVYAGIKTTYIADQRQLVATHQLSVDEKNGVGIVEDEGEHDGE